MSPEAKRLLIYLWTAKSLRGSVNLATESFESSNRSIKSTNDGSSCKANPLRSLSLMLSLYQEQPVSWMLEYGLLNPVKTDLCFMPLLRLKHQHVQRHRFCILCKRLRQFLHGRKRNRSPAQHISLQREDVLDSR